MNVKIVAIFYCTITILFSKDMAYGQETVNGAKKADNVAHNLSNNLISINTSIAHVSGSYSRKISSLLYTGIGVGGGVGYNYILNWKSNMYETFMAKLFISYIPNHVFQLESGVQTSLHMFPGNGDNDQSWGDLYGIYILPSIGSRNIKVGTRVSIAYWGFKDQIIYSTPIFINLNFYL